MANPPTNQFLPNSLGEVGQAPSFQLPEEFTKIWAPTGLSLEEINRRKEAVRTFSRELDTKVLSFHVENTGAAANGSFLSGYVIPKNKKIFVYNALLSFHNNNTAAKSKVSWFFGDSVSKGADTSIDKTTLPQAIAGAVSPYSNKSSTFAYPVVGKEEEAIIVLLANFIGDCELTLFYWEEDVGFSA